MHNHPLFDNPYYTPSELGLNTKYHWGTEKKVEEIVTVR